MPPPPRTLFERFSVWFKSRASVPDDAAPPEDARASTPAAEGLERRRATPATQAPLARPQSAFAAQAVQLERLRLHAHTDPVTGLANRRHFLAGLDTALAEPGAPGSVLLLVRVVDLGGLNRRIGFEATDRLLCNVAEVLQNYPQRVESAFAGRLNGSDFALYLPVPGVAEETAASVLRALGVSPAVMLGSAEFVIGGVDPLRAQSAGSALAAADAALARAEAAGSGSVRIDTVGPGSAPVWGEREWRLRIERAFAEGRTALGEYPVRSADGALVHLECPLRVQLDTGGPFQAASRWLAMAARGRLLPRVDLAAIELALGAIERDGVARCVHVGSASLATIGFVGEVARRLEARADAAAKLWLEVAQTAPAERLLPRLREAGAAWRRYGVHFGLEHAGAAMSTLPRLAGAGLDHVKIDARFVRGVALDSSVAEFASQLVALVHGLGVQVYAEGVDDAEDLRTLWSLGFDGATGPVVAPRSEPLRA